MGDTLRWGILGTGKIARNLATALAESARRHGRRRGEPRRRPSRRVRGRVRRPRSFGDYEGVVADDEVDIVFVALHHPFHREWAVRAADAGKHLLCEKPMAVNHGDAAEIVEAARRNDVFLQEAFAYRCHPQTRQLVRLLEDGAIGEVRMIDAVFGYDAGPSPGNYLLVHELAGGSILDVGCYPTSMAHLIASVAVGGTVAPTVGVSGAGHIGPCGVDHSAAATLEFEDGLLARVACSIQANLDSSLRIYGSEGRIAVPSPWLPGRIGTKAQIMVDQGGLEPDVIDIPLEADVYTVEADAVNDAVREGERSPAAMPWEESLENLRTLDRWRAAIGLRYRSEHA